MALDRLRKVAELSVARASAVRGRGEEATKQALVLPVIDALGYDIWNPAEVCPEYEADFAVKKAGQREKVDLAIVLDGLPVMFLEVKALETQLDGHEGQLGRYFNATTAVRLGILTNGIEWRFFTDTGDPNIMDLRPFHTVRLDSLDHGLDVFSRFAKSALNPESIREYATELLYVQKMACFLRNELDLREREPSEYFIRWILKSEAMYTGLVTAAVVDRFRPIVKGALTRVVREVVRRSIAAMDEEAGQYSDVPQGQPSASQPVTAQVKGELGTDCSSAEAGKPDIITTEEELHAFRCLQKIWESSELCTMEIFDASIKKRVPAVLDYKDTTGYFGVYINKPSWWVVRVVFGAKQSWIGFNVDESLVRNLVPAGVDILSPSPWAPFRVRISGPEDIERLSDIFIATIKDFARLKG